MPAKPISRRRFKSVSGSTSHTSQRTAREQTSQLISASSLLKMTSLPNGLSSPSSNTLWALAPS